MTLDPEDILTYLKKPDYSPMRRKELARAMHVADEDYPEFRSALNEMVEDGRVVLGRGRRYAIVQQTGRLTGIVEVKRGNFGFLRPRDPGSQDLFQIPLVPIKFLS